MCACRLYLVHVFVAKRVLGEPNNHRVVWWLQRDVGKLCGGLGLQQEEWAQLAALDEGPSGTDGGENMGWVVDVKPDVLHLLHQRGGGVFAGVANKADLWMAVG